MARRRKTKAERDQELWASERKVWNEFLPLLDRIQTLPEAQLLVIRGPRVDEPGRRFYSNLGYFLQHFSVPAGASHDELVRYLQLIHRFDASGVLKPGVLQRVAEGLEQAIAAKRATFGSPSGPDM